MSRNDIKFLGGHSSEVTPDPIPNSEVKLTSADGTAGETLWESRSPPRFRFEAGKCLIALPRFQFFLTYLFHYPRIRFLSAPYLRRRGVFEFDRRNITELIWVEEYQKFLLQ